MNKSFYSGEKIIYTEEEHKVLYKISMEHEYLSFSSCVRDNKQPGYAAFTCEDFIASLTAHIPNRGQKYINYYGYYSSKNRGLRGDAFVHKKESGQVKEQKMPTEEQRCYDGTRCA